jgi:hypothetical protein
MAFWLPATLLEQRIKAAKVARRSFPAGADTSQQPFAPLERLPVSRPPFQDRSSRPTASLPCCAVLQNRSACGSFAHSGSPRFGRDHDRRPVSCIAARQSPSVLGSPLPLGAFRPFRIKAFNPIPDREAHLPNASACLSLPASGSICIVPTADQRSRLVSLPEGSLFLEPLGTKCYVHLKDRLQSNENCRRTQDFLSFVSVAFLAFTATPAWIACG